MAAAALNGPLADLDQAELRRLARVADRLFAGRPRETPGNRPHRLRPGQGIEFLDHRAYQPGDSLRDIDWLASARSRTTQVRRYRNETAADWFICLDRSASMGSADGGKWDMGVRLGAALAYLLIHLDNRVGLILFSDRVDSLRPLGRGQRGYTALLRQLERAAPDPRGGGTRIASCTAHIPRGCQLVLLSDFLVAEGLQRDLERLAAIGERVQAIQLLSRDDQLTGDGADCMLRDLESGETLSVTLTPQATEQAARRTRELTGELARACRRLRIGFSSCDAGDDWRQVLLRHITRPGVGRA
ncbi:MAG TPA: DUF58 domain-containing protein [Sedimenticola sp.]|nr:DUF58 domain-containing protein [Sedimenticola sp.]